MVASLAQSFREIEELIQSYLNEEQCGYQSRRNIIDNIFILFAIAFLNKGMDWVLAALDQLKAFDTVNRIHTWVKLFKK